MAEAFRKATQNELDPVGRPSSRSDLVRERLKEAILAGTLPPGSPLVERELAAQLGVSKTPVREALISLSRTGLVTITRTRGMSVATVDDDMIEWVYELRLVLEPAGVAAGVNFWTEEDLAEASQILKHSRALGEASDWSSLAQSNRAFHRKLYSASPNELLCAVLDDLQDRVALMSVQDWKERPSWWSRRADEHEGILEAIAAGDAQRAADLTRRHVASFGELRARLADAP